MEELLNASPVKMGLRWDGKKLVWVELGWVEKDCVDVLVLVFLRVELLLI